MQIGLGKCDFRVPLGNPLGGYANSQEPATSVLDPLQVRVLLIASRQTFYGCINVDLVAVDEGILTPVRQFLSKKGIPSNHVVIMATHTHAGPGGILRTDTGLLSRSKEVFKRYDPELVAIMLPSIYQAIEEALADLSPGRLAYGVTRLPKVASNRNQAHIRASDRLDLLKVTNAHRQALLVGFACHPTVLNALNQGYSGDFPGAINRKMQAGTPAYYYASFLNGACGDISTRFTRQGSDAEEVNRIGSLFYQKLTEDAMTFESLAEDSMAMRTFQVALTPKPQIDPEQARIELEGYQIRYHNALKDKILTTAALRKLEADLEGAHVNLDYALAAFHSEQVMVSVTLWQIGHHIWVCIPGELYSSLGRRLVDDTTHLICYTNGYLGYFADRSAFKAHHYEAFASHVQIGQAEVLVDQIRREITEYRGGSSNDHY